MLASPHVIAACLLAAANTYQVPPAVMIGILHVERYRGAESGPNINGSFDLGPMQVNTMWMPQLARYWGIDARKARVMVRDNVCVNMKVSAWILKQKIGEAGDLAGGIARYHSATPALGQRYARKVISAMERHGLIDHGQGAGRERRVAQR